VRSPAGAALAGLLSQQGGAVTAETDGGLAVTGLDAAAIGGLARAHGITLHELTPRHASLEEAFMELTQDSIDYRAGLPADTRKAA
jgi:ABC-2 type transport system ATP-binding protein